jgi:serine/threonine protein kinase
MLVSSGLISNLQLSIALAAQQTSNKRLGEIVVERGFCTEDEIALCLAEQYGYPSANLEVVEPQPQALALLKADFAIDQCILPIQVTETEVELVVADPSNVVGTDHIALQTKKRLSILLAPRTALQHKIREAYGFANVIEVPVRESNLPPRFGNLRVSRTVGVVTLVDAFDQELDRKVTLVSSPRGTNHEQAFKSRVQASGRVPSAWVAPVHDWFDYEDNSWAIFSRLEGESLAQFLKIRGPRSMTQAAELVAQVAEGVHALNQDGGYTGLVTPENVLVTSAGAQLVPLSEPREDYDCPEGVGGNARTPASDVFALGTLLWECVLGQSPHVNNGKVYWQNVDSHAANVPTAMAEVINRCLAKEPDQRYSSPLMLANALRSYNWSVVGQTTRETANVSNADRDQLLTIMNSAPAEPPKQGFWAKIFGRAA